MYFTNNKLHKYEREMKTIPGFGEREPWEGKRKCSDCRNNDFSIRVCAKCDCPYLARKMESYSSVTTDQLLTTFLRSISYSQLHKRLNNALRHFKGSKLYISTDHLKLFRHACIMSKVSKRNYNMIASIVGQNSDGFGEGLEQREIPTEDGDLFVSMWNFGDDYFVYDEEEMKAHLSGENLGWYIQ